MLKYCFLCIVLENGRYLPLIIWLDNLSSVLRIFLALKEKPIKRSWFYMSYTLLVGGHNCIIAGDFIKKGGGYCRKRGRLLSHKMHIAHTTHCIHNIHCIYYIHYIHYIHDVHSICYIHEIHYIVYIFYIVDLSYIRVYNIEKKKIRYKKSAIYTRLPTD